MGFTVNYSSVLSKVSNVVGVKQQNGSLLKDAKKLITRGNKALLYQSDHSPQEAAEKFVEVLTSTVQGNVGGKLLTDRQAEAILSDISISEPTEVGDGLYKVTISFGKGHSESLYPEGYPNGIDDLVMLFDRGVGHEMHMVWGLVNGKMVYSQTVINRTDFIGDSIARFWIGYAKEYGVQSIHLAE